MHNRFTPIDRPAVAVAVLAALLLFAAGAAEVGKRIHDVAAAANAVIETAARTK